MIEAGERKLFAGGKLRRLRRELGLTQTRMAEDLGVSPSYLNHLERNQRPMTAQLLLRMADAFDLDLRQFAGDQAGGAADLGEAMADPLFADLKIARHEIAEVAENAPSLAEAILRLYQAYLDGRRVADLGAVARPEDGVAGAGSALGAKPGWLPPADWVRDYIQAGRNYFADLEEAAEAMVAEMAPESQEFAGAARARLKARHGIEVRIVPREILPDALRRYDYHRKRLFLSEFLDGPGRAFALAYQLASFEGAGAIAALVERASPPDRATRSLLKVTLSNYFAAALLMPYDAFLAAVEKSSYDIQAVQARFGVSYEQACHRLTTLARPGARGVPFFMLRVDQAGNVSKRYAGAAFPFSRFGGTCPRWNIHGCFKTPGAILPQIVETPDGARYFTLARTVRRMPAIDLEDTGELAIGLGCDLKYASRLVYSRGLDLATPRATAIGPACRICERANCPQRAAEPLNRTLQIDDTKRTITAFPFVGD